ncbi:TetR/AcrR family transcriptional regulator [Actinomadura madurae]|uniref:TetR/AcrR family transcriptional regulator n=1 Tax=Actinomadura madurae TaxID=1993 RepID=UPI0020D20E15|nr:TetR/AcrR family transcriptional regulator [Actinomadura madurae]MCP9969849.1 TetR/AcrR family transcriptional regulator [Actinomadura madurae]MCQ0006169.1 TetR/AcrR family transcriptional regulator [Actinomadura madurae]
MTDERPEAKRPSGGGPRPRRDRREQTRTALLTAAERLWAERGIHGASLDDIAAAAGLTKGAVYSNFAGKTDLLLALMERITSDRTRTGVCEELHAAAEDADPTGRSSPRHDADDAPRRLALLLVEFWLYGMRDYAARLAHSRLVRRTPRPARQRAGPRRRRAPRRPRHPHHGPRRRPGLPTPPGPRPSPHRPLQNRQIPNATPHPLTPQRAEVSLQVWKVILLGSK